MCHDDDLLEILRELSNYFFWNLAKIYSKALTQRSHKVNVWAAIINNIILCSYFYKENLTPDFLSPELISALTTVSLQRRFRHPHCNNLVSTGRSSHKFWN